jgi:hypothetical protein
VGSNLKGHKTYKGDKCKQQAECLVVEGALKWLSLIAKGLLQQDFQTLKTFLTSLVDKFYARKIKQRQKSSFKQTKQRQSGFNHTF